MAARELPLKTFWESLGGRFTVQDSLEFVSAFGNVLDEYKAAKKQAALFDCSAFGKISVRGPDRITWLHRILTNDLIKLRPGEGCPAAILSATGKVLAMMEVLIFSEEVRLLTEMGREKDLMILLDRYLITEDVQMRDMTHDFSLFSVQGPKSESLAEHLFSWRFRDLPPLSHKAAASADGPVELVKESFTGRPGFDLWAGRKAAEGLARKLLEAGQTSGLRPAGFEAMEILRIEAGIPRYGIDIDETMTLPETGLEDTFASETKGCYPGQEVVARTKTYGGLNRKITGLIFESRTLPAKGDKIFAPGGGKEIGSITSACTSPALAKGIAIGIVSKGSFEHPAEVTIRTANGDIHAKTTPLRSLG